MPPEFVTENTYGMNGGDSVVAAAVASPEENEFRRDVDGEDRENEGVEVDEEQEKACDQFNNLNIQDGEGEEEEAELRPKLAEGFYEIEAVRRRRVRKGQVQYLIKWRDWPETANTWEPYDNLISCSDVIEAFEESLRSGKHRSRKRKRRSSGLIPQAKKKPQCISAAATSSVVASEVKFDEGNFIIPSLDDASHENGGMLVTENINNDERGEERLENGLVDIPPQVEEAKDQFVRDVNFVESFCTPFTSEHLNRLARDILETDTPEVICFENGHQNVDGEGLVQTGCRSGNRKRKPAHVKRFNQEQTPCVTNYAAQDLTPKNTRSCGIIGEHWDKRSVYKCNDLGDNNPDMFPITKIIKPISFASSESVPGILVTFMAKRSDGKEVMVDNKYLKAHNPLLLINYYEQHLNYNVTG